jgi:hypothetical protein
MYREIRVGLCPPCNTRVRQRRSLLGWDQIELILSQFNVFRLRLAPNKNAVDLGAPRPERAAQLDNLASQAPGEADLYTVSELEECDRFFLFVLGHRSVLLI